MYNLYIDESGQNNLIKLDARRPHFCFVGLIIKEEHKENFKILANQIKFKFWNRTDIVFHATDLKRLSGVFIKFRNFKKELSIDGFYKDMLEFLNNSPVKLSIQCLNKINYINNNPPVKYALGQGQIKGFQKMVRGVEKNIIELCVKGIFISYLDLLMREKEKGQIIIEATGSVQDLFISKVYNDLLSNGYKGFNMKGEDVRKYFTSISFVTKNNDDVETQVADLFAYYVNCEARTMDGLETPPINSFDEKIIQIIKSKSFEYSKELTFGNFFNSFQKLH